MCKDYSELVASETGFPLRNDTKNVKKWIKNYGVFCKSELDFEFIKFFFDINLAEDVAWGSSKTGTGYKRKYLVYNRDNDNWTFKFLSKESIDDFDTVDDIKAMIKTLVNPKTYLLQPMK